MLLNLFSMMASLVATLVFLGGSGAMVATNAFLLGVAGVKLNVL